ncbi:cysteine-rich receptor-like protein kinase 26 isoform X2 [Triticum urartu]|nr:cysteine-rich receptor-like protein kinase 26 isoform X2 [Triticum urartu]
MSSPPPEPCSGFGTPNFPFQANSQGTSGESRMPGYHFFKQATGDFSKKIGKGQFGKVYKAYLPTGEVIAVKLLHQMSKFDDEQFSHHCTQLMSTNHKNLVRLLGYSYGEHEESHLYDGRVIRGVYKRRLIGFEYVPGGSLANFLSEQHLGWSIRFKIIKEICEGLQYLQEAGIVHFNLNPGNILLDNGKIPKITEFGLYEMFKAVNDGATVTRGCTYRLRYMAPEIYCYGKMSERSDIFSLGALIKSIMAGTTDSSIHHMDGPKCVEHVHKSWRKRLQEIRRYRSFEADCQQVRTCIGIAVACMHRDPGERPLMKDIVRKLYEVETREDYLSSRVEQAVHDYEVRRISFQEMEHVTSNFSQKLGHDGLGAVYKGKLEDGEVIAVKRFDERLRKLEEQFERVVNLMKLRHKNIVRLTGYCYEPTKVPVPDDKNPELYIWWDVIENLLCYEFLPNGSLDMILNDKSCELDWQTRHKIIHGICEGLHHLHVECQDAPLVHEGFKPANVLLDNGMVPKLADFCTSMAVTPRG